MTDPSPVHPPSQHAASSRWAPVWVLAFVVLWPVHGYAEGILALGALTTVIWLLLARRSGRGTRLLSPRAWALTSALFIAYWLPQLVSSVGALDPGRALKESLLDLRYLPFLWLAAVSVASPRARRMTFAGLALIVLVWSVDGVLEGITGTSPLFWCIDQMKQLVSGRSMCTLEQLAAADRVSGVFGPCNFKLGVVLASLSPFALFAAGRRLGAPGWALAAGLVGTAVILAGSRAAWITFALVVLCSGVGLIGWKKTLGWLVAGVLALGVLGLTVPEVRQRVLMTSQALEGSARSVDGALSGRLRIWSAALCMMAEHPLNGVGTRGFRVAFAGCDPDPDNTPFWGDAPALHAHQIVLEIASETGLIGLLLWLAGALLAWRAWRYSPPRARVRARPAMLALAVTVFPLNTHLGFYSTFWGGLTLLLAALYAGSLLGQDEGGGGWLAW